MRNAAEKKTGRLGRNVKMKRLRKFHSRSRIKPAIGSKKNGIVPAAFLPCNFFVQDVSVLRILGSERSALVLYAQHDERRVSIVAHGAFAFRSDPDHRPLGYRKIFAVYLKLAVSGKEEIQFLMVLMGVKESRFRTSRKRLE